MSRKDIRKDTGPFVDRFARKWLEATELLKQPVIKYSGKIQINPYKPRKTA